LFPAVRNAGTPDEVAAATYGLAVVAFAKGGTRDFKAPAQAALSATPSGPAGASRAAPLLYALTAIAVDDKDWPGAFGLARRLVSEYPTSDVAPDALERVGAGAREAAGDRAGALEAYGRGPRDVSAPGWTPEALFGHARLLVQDKRWDAARPILERLLKSSEPARAAEAAYALGETYNGEGDALA